MRRPKDGYSELTTQPAMCFQASRRLRRTIHDGRVRLVQGNLKDLPWQECAVDKCLAVHVAYFMERKGGP